MHPTSKEAFEEHERLQEFRIQSAPSVMRASMVWQDVMAAGLETRAVMNEGGMMKLWEMPRKTKNAMEPTEVIGRGRLRQIPQVRTSGLRQNGPSRSQKQNVLNDADVEEEVVMRAPERRPPLLSKKRPRPETESLEQEKLGAKRAQLNNGFPSKNQQNVMIDPILLRDPVELGSAVLVPPPVRRPLRENTRRDEVVPITLDQLSNMILKQTITNSSSAMPPPNLARSSLFPPLAPSAHRTSPPPQFAERHMPGESLPMNWDPLLSVTINDWLSDSATISRQTSLEYVDFESTDGSAARQRWRAANGKMRVTRFTISSNAETERSTAGQIGRMNEADLLDWFVIELQVEALNAEGRRPYWIIAFPVCAVTDVKEARTLQAATETEKVAGRCTTWTLGGPNSAPLLHGRHVPPGLFDDFFGACMRGKGRIVLASRGASFDR